MKLKILYAIALFFQVYKLLKIKMSISMNRRFIKQISSLDVISIKQLKNKIVQKVLKIGDLVLCSGHLRSSEPIKSLLNQKKNVVYSYIVMDKVFQIGDNRNTITKPIRKLIGGFLALFQDNSHINIFQTANTEMVCRNVLKKKITYRQKIFNIGWLLSIILKSPTRVISNIYYQSYIPQNAQTVVFTKIAKNTTGDIQFVRPIAIGISKQDILQSYTTMKDNNKFLSYVLYFSITLTIYLIYKQIILPSISKYMSKKKSQVNRIQKIQVKDLNCSKCNKVLSNIINSPCGHLVVCSDCNNLQANCLQCDRKTKDKIVIYPC